MALAGTFTALHISEAPGHLAGAVRTQVDIADFRCHEFCAPRKGFVNDKGALPVGSQAFAGALDELLD